MFQLLRVFTYRHQRAKDVLAVEVMYTTLIRYMNIVHLGYGMVLKANEILINVSIICCISIPCVSYRFGPKVMHGTKAATNARFAIEALTLEWPAMHPMDTYIVQVNILDAIRFIN